MQHWRTALGLMPFVLGGCALAPQQGVPLDTFIHNLSHDMDCLRFCAGHSPRGSTSFAGKDALDITLSISNEGRITGHAAPNLLTFTGLGWEQQRGQAGKVTLRLYPTDHCRRLKLIIRDRKEPVELGPSSAFFGILGNTEYLYIQGKTTDPWLSDAQIFQRWPMEKIEEMRCLPVPAPQKAPPGCTCPGE